MWFCKIFHKISQKSIKDVRKFYDHVLHNFILYKSVILNEDLKF